MKTAHFVLFLILVALFGCAKKNTLSKLKIMEEDYPRVFFFRASENTSGYDTYEEWEDTFDNLTGFIGQALPFDRANPARFEKNPEYFTRFKKDNPDQIVLMHLNGNEHDPRNLPVKDLPVIFFAGHWLYYEGSMILSDIPADTVNTAIRVSDAGKFLADAGWTMDRQEDIGLCMLDQTGKPSWQEAEQVQLVSVDTVQEIIVVKRGLYGTGPRAFPAGKAYAASHVWNGPWNSQENLVWQYNFSTLCPRDQQGMNGGDMLAHYLASALGQKGPLYNIDGIADDVIYNRPQCKPRNSRGRSPDFDADGKGDDYLRDSTFAIGVIGFFRELRNNLGEERIITSDGQHMDNQRAVGILNGIESEGWPDGLDTYIRDWSGGLNRLMFWNQNGRHPVFSYINHKYYRNADVSNITINYPRLIMAASVLTNTPYCLSWTPDKFPAIFPTAKSSGIRKPEVWDELVMGKANIQGWLGKPLGHAIHVARRETDLLGGAGAPPTQQLLQRLRGETTAIKLGNGTIEAESSSSEVRIRLQNIPCKCTDLTVFISARGAPKNGFPPEYAREIRVSIIKPSLAEARINDESEKNSFSSFVNEKEFTSSFYFSDLQTETVDLEILVEAGDPVWITGIEAYAHPDAMYREFEHGLVLANPSTAPCTFNLETLFPGKAFRRLEGSANQDLSTNDGSLVTGPVTLQGKDALFLIKEL